MQQMERQTLVNTGNVSLTRQQQEFMKQAVEASVGRVTLEQRAFQQSVRPLWSTLHQPCLPHFVAQEGVLIIRCNLPLKNGKMLHMVGKLTYVCLLRGAGQRATHHVSGAADVHCVGHVAVCSYGRRHGQGAGAWWRGVLRRVCLNMPTYL